ncbi:iron complex transport system substrate-binding protein [Pedobacter psychrotolerans]|uniref:Cobalamin-binding protein n=1 Tax=Pedobacter psychrotolerans TaxID=1843235 RepID=A0A4R2H9I0_9SPHI|nr:ABC transporter substrate-binding protein [Pedobacter psychrotolerans]TCO22420.1 iron complex transport system substrate-binding protein [Pedobacter psychrotolerans]GGE64435.1 cobalamin-binding protein [Pedobacter psychrotolerans]
MKVVSFLPAATKMIYDMGLQEYLFGVTFECPKEAANQPKIVRCILEGKNYSSIEIDRIFSASKAQGKSLYWVDDELLESIAPDIVFTQDICEVCNIDTVCTETAVMKLSKQPKLVPLSPNNLQDVYECAITIAKALGKEEVALHYLANLQQKTNSILDQLRANRAPLKRVMLMEWIEPVYNCGHWIPFQIAAAGGVDMLSNPAGDSIVTPWEKILKYNPEVLVIAPCGFDINRTREEMNLLTSKKGWEDLEAVKQNQVYLADFDMFTQPSIGTLVEGIEALACMFHPDLFTAGEQLADKFINLKKDIFFNQPA